ncbi:MAG TPA: glycoside hydrolase family 2 TIM barrel-domain containing protein [Capsulimonadaceae bacterium]|jgi:beta-galactosidase
MKPITLLAVVLAVFASFVPARAQSPVQLGARTFIDLDGTWDTRANMGLQCNFPPAQDGWKPEAVPQQHSSLIKSREMSWSYMKPVSEYKKEGKANYDTMTDLSAWYRRKFAMPAKADRTSAILTFDSMVAKSVVWLNGVKLGECVTGTAPTSYDISKAVRWGGDNELVVWLAGCEALVDLKNELFVAQHNQVGVGILGDVRIEAVSACHIEDAYVKTSVARKQIDIDLTVSNTGASAATVKPSCVVDRYSDRRPCLTITGDAVTIAAGETKTVTVSSKWDKPVLWSPATPFLYVAACRLSAPTGEALDDFEQRFGFREFTISGRQFLLNGTPITLFRTEAGSFPSATYEEIYGADDPMRGGTLKEIINHPPNHIRVHGGGPLVPQMADENGVTISAHLAAFWPSTEPLDPKLRPLWMPNLKDHYTKVVKSLRNHPSIVIWNMANETYWGNVPGNPDMKAVCKEVVDTVHSVDTLRPLDGDAEAGWDGLLDIMNIHYPGAPGDVSRQYPNSGAVVPNDLYWLKDTGNNAWRFSFDWNKPLAIGEYSMIPSTPDAYSGYGGEEAYNWIKEAVNSRGAETAVHVSLMQKMTDVYRIQGVALLGPWISDGNDVIPRFAIRPLDFHPNLWGGKTANRKVSIFYESDTWLTNAKLQCMLLVDGRIVWENSVPLHLKHGANVLDVPITAPSVVKMTRAELVLRLRYDRSGYTPERLHYSEPVFVFPPASLAGVDVAKIALLDPSGSAAKSLNAIGLTLIPLKSLSAGGLTGKRVLLVAGDAPLASAKDALIGFAEKGGTVILLQRQDTESLGAGFPEIDKSHVASRVWLRSHGHPALAGLDDAQLSYWRPDNLVGKLNYSKPTDGDTKVLIDAGGIRGMEWAPLCETPTGTGRVIFSQLSLLDRLDAEPVASDILCRLLRYGMTAGPDRPKALRVLSAGNAKLDEVLALCRIVTSRGIAGDGPVLWDASYKATPAEIAKLKAEAQTGGKVWLHGFTPESVASTSALLGFAAALDPTDPKMKTAVRVSNSPLTDNLSSADFEWAKLDLWNRGGFLGGAVSTAKLGSYKLRLPAIDSGEPLIEPGLLVAINSGKGQLLFDTLDWETASGAEGERVIRIVSALAMNVGAKVAKPAGDAYDYFPIEFAKFANMGYVDEVADDGKGGWLDMGKFDLCFFLTNHTEKLNGTGAAIAAEPFPEDDRFGGVPFHLVAPKKNDGKAMISLRGNNRALKLPEKVDGIVIGRKADKLWFVNAASYVPHDKGVVIAKYVFHYADGTTAEFPLRSGIEINDWSTPQKPERAKICWTGNNRVQDNVGLFLTEWTNPSPAKVIKSMDIVGALTGAQLGVVGISGGVAKAGAGIRLARWEFSDPTAVQVADSVGGVVLHLQKRKDAGDPVADTLNGEPAIKVNGQYFSGDLSKIAGFDPSKPFTTKVAFALAPFAATGRDNGLFESFNYLKGGFRIGVDNREHHFWMEYYPQPDGKQTILRGKTALEPGKSYVCSIVFDGSGAKLFLNGRVEGVNGGGMTLPFKGPFSVGQCSGSGVLNGTLQSVEITQN